MALSAGLTRSRLLWLLLGCLALVFVLGPVGPLLPTAHAQEGDDGAATPAAKPVEKSRSVGEIFRHILKSVGWFFGAILLFVSIALVALIVLLVMELRLGAAIPPGFVEDFTDTVNKRRFKEAYEMAKEDGSFLGRVLTTGMSRLQYGIDDAREAAFNMVDSIKAGKDQLVTYLATIGTLGPLLGLVGTVWGMILSFMTLSSSATGVNASKLADDISHALVVTLLGIGLSVPAIFCHAFFRNRLIRLAHDTSNVADDLLTQMYHNSKKAAPVPEVPVAVEARAVPSAGVRPK
jgi:biopolymer transport protein ExbB